ncbi:MULTISPECIES: baseplate J/gp47 family protein [unclassified Neptuniibacter]|uniref:baseplate J/gp47 family protein n=1 Tax=unclassified Neptuniibacter TaxID=2630693 RepID=UPI0025CEC7DB|nr:MULTISPECIES: baseplate J/gp47 family protein [unclassified Neptuniibacter]|tara:strand:- start:224 stop:1273 length:1050 start_codon:yes stop_codon:yes gene_type:complete
MPFLRKALKALREQVSTDIERHSGESASARGDTYYPIAQAVAGIAHGLHGHLQYNVDQLFDESADDENLLRRAAEMGIYQIGAFRASGTATITGNEGATVEAETLLQDDNQQLYRVTESTTIVTGTATLQLTSVEAGASGNLAAGITLRLVNSILDIDSTATVIEITGGADVESIQRVAERLSERRKNPPMGGNDNDYIAWVKAAHVDVTRAWCYSNTPHIGAVTVRFVTDNLSTPIPTETHINAVTDYTDTVRPSGMRGFSVGALVGKPLDITFSRLIPNNIATRVAINAELNDLIQREGKPGGILLLSQINEAISLATGETDHRIDLTDDFTCFAWQIPELGVMTWP